MTRKNGYSSLVTLVSLLLSVAVLLSACGKVGDAATTVSPTEQNPAESVSETETEEVMTTEEITAAPTEESPESVIASLNLKPENVLQIENPEDKVNYLSSLVLSLVEIPPELGDECYVKFSHGIFELGTAPDGIGKYYEMFAPAYFLKDNSYDSYYVREEGHFTFRELQNSEQETEYLYNAHGGWVRNDLFERKDKTADEIRNIKYSTLFTISGDLSQEILPAGESNKNAKYYLFDNNAMLIVGLLHTKLTGECYGRITADVYMMDRGDRNVSAGFWVCFEGMDPIRIPEIASMTYELTEAPEPVVGANFEEEKENALCKFSFDLMIEPPQSEE